MSYKDQNKDGFKKSQGSGNVILPMQACFSVDTSDSTKNSNLNIDVVQMQSKSKPEETQNINTQGDDG